RRSPMQSYAAKAEMDIGWTPDTPRFSNPLRSRASSAMSDGYRMLYKSTPEAMQAVIAGEVDLATPTVHLAEPTILADKVTGIAITSAQRWPTLPDVPTIAEGGIPEMPVDAWFGLFAPARTPPAIVEAIAREVRAIEQIPD